MEEIQFCECGCRCQIGQTKCFTCTNSPCTDHQDRFKNRCKKPEFTFIKKDHLCPRCKNLFKTSSLTPRCCPSCTINSENRSEAQKWTDKTDKKPKLSSREIDYKLTYNSHVRNNVFRG